MNLPSIVWQCDTCKTNVKTAKEAIAHCKQEPGESDAKWAFRVAIKSYQQSLARATKQARNGEPRTETRKSLTAPSVRRGPRVYTVDAGNPRLEDIRVWRKNEHGVMEIVARGPLDEMHI